MQSVWYLEADMIIISKISDMIISEISHLKAENISHNPYLCPLFPLNDSAFHEFTYLDISLN